MVDSPTVELGVFAMSPDLVPEVGSKFERDGVVYEVTSIKDEGGFFEGRPRQFRFFGKETDA